MKTITLICVPFQMDVGRWGYALGPQAFLEAGLITQLQSDQYHVCDPIWIDLPRNERTRDTITNLSRIASRTAAAVHHALQEPESLVIVLEGDCTHALGAVGGLAQAKGTPGIVWFDAHGDLCTLETTTSGYWGGMPFAVALGWEFSDWREAAGLTVPVRPEAAILLGTSDLDAGEQEALKRVPLLHFPAETLAEPEGARQLQQALLHRRREAHTWYLHIDVDVAGPEEVPGALTPAPFWPPRQRLLQAASDVAHVLPLSIISLATYNPTGDPHKRGASFGLAMLRAIFDGMQAHM